MLTLYSPLKEGGGGVNSGEPVTMPRLYWQLFAKLTLPVLDSRLRRIYRGDFRDLFREPFRRWDVFRFRVRVRFIYG